MSLSVHDVDADCIPRGFQQECRVAARCEITGAYKEAAARDSTVRHMSKTGHCALRVIVAHGQRDAARRTPTSRSTNPHKREARVEKIRHFLRPGERYPRLQLLGSNFHRRPSCLDVYFADWAYALLHSINNGLYAMNDEFHRNLECPIPSWCTTLKQY